jgi:ubiquinone biosynthesis protein
LFAAFDERPIASASLAQVHSARLSDGRHVAVKVQYSGIEAIVKKDLRTIKSLLSFLSFFFRIKGLENIHTQFSEMINEELDFRKEAENIKAIAANFTGDTNVVFPKVIDEFSTKRVLTTEFMEGANISDSDTLTEFKVDANLLAERLITAYCQMIFSDGIYHADPHPGNILVQPDGRLVFLDFGAVAKLSDAMKEGLLELIKGILKRNSGQISAALKKMGVLPRGEDNRDIERLVDYLYGKFLEQLSIDSFNLSDVHADMKTKMEVFSDLSKMNISMSEIMSSFQIPKDLVLLQRTLLLLLGLCTHLSPTINPMKTIQPYLEEFILGKDKNWFTLIESAVKEIALSAITLPANLQNLLVKANQGKIEVNVKGLSANANLFYALGHQLLSGFFAMFFGGLGYISHSKGELALSNWMFGLGAFSLLCLGYSLLGARKWQKKN